MNYYEKYKMYKSKYLKLRIHSINGGNKLINKDVVMKYYFNTWMPYMDNYIKYFKPVTINYKDNKIRLSLSASPFHYSYTLQPISKNNILSSEFSLIVWLRDGSKISNIKSLTNENPIELKQNIDGSWKDVYNLLKYIKKSMNIN
jgi:hypothetical protein